MVNRINLNPSPLCKLCDNQVVEDLQHAFFSCPFNNMTSQALINMLSHPLPNLNPAMLLNLNFQIEEALELPMVWLTTDILRKI
jgi:hypothetical protein